MKRLNIQLTELGDSQTVTPLKRYVGECHGNSTYEGSTTFSMPHPTIRTCLCYPNDVPVLEAYWDGLSLDGSRFFVAKSIDHFQDGSRNIRLLPKPNAIGNLAT